MFFCVFLHCIIPPVRDTAAKDSSLSLSRPLLVRWSYETRELNPHTPAAHDDVLYAPLLGGVVAAVRPQDGQLIWRTEAGGEISAAPAADERGVYVASELSAAPTGGVQVYTKGVVRALSRTSGVTLWTRTVPNPLEGSLIISGGLLFGASTDGRIYALDRGTGVPAWIVQSQHSFTSAPAIVGDSLYVAAEDGVLLALDVKAGAISGRYRTGNASRAQFSVAGRTLYAGSSDGFVSALNIPGAKLRKPWRRRAGTSVQTLTSTPNGLVVTSLDNFVHFLAHRDGDRLWKKQMPGRILGRPLVSSDSALFAILGGEVCVALSLSDGRQVNTLPLGEGNAAVASPVLAGSFLIVPTRNGLIAFGPSDVSSKQ